MKLDRIAPVALGACLWATAATGQTAEGPIYSSAEDVKPLLVGLTIPEGTLEGPPGEDVTVGPGQAGGPAIYVFYRGFW